MRKTVTRKENRLPMTQKLTKLFHSVRARVYTIGLAVFLAACGIMHSCLGWCPLH